MREALVPTTSAMARRAERAAADVVDAALAEVADALDAARETGRDRRAQARAEGMAQAEVASRATITTARRAARADVLAAERAAFEAVSAEADRLAAMLLADPRWPEVQAGLVRVARTAIGADAEVSEPLGGGAVARGHGALVDVSLPTLTRQAFARVVANRAFAWTAS